MLVGALPAEAATSRRLHGERAQWSLTDHLLALVVDRLAIVSWQLAGDRKAPYPKPMPRPGVPDQTLRHGHTTRPAAEVIAFLRRIGPSRQEEVTDG